MAKVEKKQRIAVIDFDKCQPKRCAFLCIRVCPINRMGKECIVENPESHQPNISEELCSGCGICIHKCPFGAITVENLPSALQQPIHQFGANLFRLYRLPLPCNGSVVGLVGRNGLGKTTVLKILSGQLVPNLGEFGAERSLDDAIAFFKGRELQAFFEGLKDGKLAVSLKPQHVDGIPRLFSGTVQALLERADEKKQLLTVAKALEIEKTLGREISKVSGGELQRIAIAAAVLKKADIYFFDEPCSYLDVSQRLKVASFIRSLASESLSVIVVEHDLAVLDYLTDYVHVLYGKPKAYGIVSGQKTSKAGVNEFLDGYIRDENMRFRDKELRFEVKPPVSELKSRLAFSYPALEKSFPNFSLKTSAGGIKAGEVIGILGPNATGKTTFVKMLAGIEKPDNAQLPLRQKVSFKPQYLSAADSQTVSSLFASASIDSELLETTIERRLRVKEFFDRGLSSLSGGELQRVAIAFCLARSDADIFLLDEPSAFIDIEDRLQAAQLIREVVDKKKKVAMVVDHDILFQDSVSNRLVVFSGIPAEKGFASEPMQMQQGMNSFLKEMGITFRRDPETGRPRANKADSVKDREQKEKGEYYYS